MRAGHRVIDGPADEQRRPSKRTRRRGRHRRVPPASARPAERASGETEAGETEGRQCSARKHSKASRYDAYGNACRTRGVETESPRSTDATSRYSLIHAWEGRRLRSQIRWELVSPGGRVGACNMLRVGWRALAYCGEVQSEVGRAWSERDCEGAGMSACRGRQLGYLPRPRDRGERADIGARRLQRTVSLEHSTAGLFRSRNRLVRASERTQRHIVCTAQQLVRIAPC